MLVMWLRMSAIGTIAGPVRARYVQKCMQQQKWQKREHYGEFGKYGKNDNFATIANMAKHKAMRGPIKVSDTGEFGKYGENDILPESPTWQSTKQRGAHKSWRYWQIWQIWRKWQFCHNRQPGMDIYKRVNLQRVLRDSKQLCGAYQCQLARNYIQ